MDEKYFNIRDVAQHIGLNIYDDRGNECYVTCPYCGKAEHKANICITKEGSRVDSFHCFHCNEKRNLYGLLADYYGTVDGKYTRFQIARWKFLKELELGTPGNTPMRVVSSDTSKPIKRRTVEEVDKVYRALHQELSLSKMHQEALKERGLQGTDLEFFKSVPDSTESYSVCRKLIRKGYDLSRVPGFFRTKKNNDWTLSHSFRGFLVPVADLSGKISGYQVRLDKPLDGVKYIWLSSSNKNSGISSGSPCGFYGNRSAKTVYFVDGILKALICSRLYSKKDILFVGVAGVNNSKSIEDAIRAISKLGKAQRIVNAFDMDEFTDVHCNHNYKKCEKCKCSNNQICTYKKRKVESLVHASEKLENLSEKYGYSYKRVVWNIKNNHWDETVKGLDDYLLKHL